MVALRRRSCIGEMNLCELKREEWGHEIRDFSSNCRVFLWRGRTDMLQNRQYSTMPDVRHRWFLSIFRCRLTILVWRLVEFMKVTVRQRWEEEGRSIVVMSRVIFCRSILLVCAHLFPSCEAWLFFTVIPAATLRLCAIQLDMGVEECLLRCASILGCKRWMHGEVSSWITVSLIIGEDSLWWSPQKA